jgi:hypothetical protein
MDVATESSVVDIVPHNLSDDPRKNKICIICNRPFTDLTKNCLQLVCTAVCRKKRAAICNKKNADIMQKKIKVSKITETSKCNWCGCRRHLHFGKSCSERCQTQREAYLRGCKESDKKCC